MRFANALVRHPILVQEQLVIMFLTVPTVSTLIFVLRHRLMIRVRNLQCGGNRPLYPCKRSSLVRA